MVKLLSRLQCRKPSWANRHCPFGRPKTGIFSQCPNQIITTCSVWARRRRLRLAQRCYAGDTIVALLARGCYAPTFQAEDCRLPTALLTAHCPLPTAPRLSNHSIALRTRQKKFWRLFVFFERQWYVIKWGWSFFIFYSIIMMIILSSIIIFYCMMMMIILSSMMIILFLMMISYCMMMLIYYMIIIIVSLMLLGIIFDDLWDEPDALFHWNALTQ